ncbi:DUF4199 domain-containing protein [Luteirhabdus pelagi]|uniref:DUF4199 domain-containing protein n=1 Tax=Luteirhabdus pelagi TaxID=2792783 RepID=UPI001939CDE5|nr:DUF4199 domain-containing protein [Luteirhabdus pelagi]
MKTIKIELKWAILFTITLLAWSWLEKTLGWHDSHIEDHSWGTFLFTPIAIFLYLLALREKRRRFFSGKMTWLQGFVTGVKIAVFVAILSPFAQYFIHTVISPDFFDNMIAHAVSSGKSTQQEAEAYFNLTSYIWQSAIGAILMGTITAAIVAIFTKRS